VATACWTSDASSVAAAYKVAIDAEPVPVRGPRDADRMWCCEVSSLVDSQIQDDVDASECQDGVVLSLGVARAGFVWS
jgi:hypothetical protein